MINRTQQVQSQDNNINGEVLLEVEPNFDTSNIVTPVNVARFSELLRLANYDEKERSFLEKGFSEGFSLEYNGTRENTNGT